MKTKNIFLLAFIIASVANLTYCKKSDTNGPVLSLVNPAKNDSNDKIEVLPMTKVVVELNIKDDEGLKSVETYNGNVPLYSSIVTNFSNSKSLNYKTPEITVNKITEIRVIATDASDNVNSFVITYVPQKVKINAFYNVNIGGNTKNLSFLDLDSGIAYSDSEVMSKEEIKNKVDLYYSDGTFYSNYSSNGINYTMGTLFSTTCLDVMTFANMWNDLNTMVYNGIYQKISIKEMYQVIFFETKEKKKGFILIVSMLSGDKIGITVKVQP